MQRTFLFFIFSTFTYFAICQNPELEIRKDGASFKENGEIILGYQAAPVSDNGAYTRANYIHPLYAPDGSMMTEDFPEDHLHHRGIFWAWHQLYIGEKRIGDGWEIKDFTWDVIKMKNRSGTLETQVLWKSPLWKKDGEEKPFVKEKTRISVVALETNYRIIDIDIQLKALEKNVKIGGSEDPKGYGGFSPRIKLASDMRFVGPNGKVEPQTNPVVAGAWLDISGPIGENGNQAGLTMICHPDNPGFPQPWILRAKGSMQNAVYPYPGAQAVPLKKLRLRYRLIVHQGNIEEIDVEGIFKAYSEK